MPLQNTALCRSCKHQEVHASVAIMQNVPLCANCTLLIAQPHHDLGRRLSAPLLSTIPERSDLEIEKPFDLPEDSDELPVRIPISLAYLYFVF